MIENSRLNSRRVFEYLNQGKRFDGRKSEDFRNIEIDCKLSKKAEGSAKVKLGNTEVWVGVKMDVGTPYPDSLNKGNLIVSAELTPMSHSKYEPGPPKFSAIELGRLVDRGIRESKFIDFEKLCIIEGEKVWNVYIDVYSVNDAGNVLDAAFIGALAALKSAKMPSYDEKEGIDYSSRKEPLPLNKEMPLNFSVYKIGNNLILDPTLEEESAAEGRLIFAATPSGKDFKICSMQKGDEVEISVEEFNSMLELVENIYSKFYKHVSDSIDKGMKNLS